MTLDRKCVYFDFKYRENFENKDFFLNKEVFIYREFYTNGTCLYPKTCVKREEIIASFVGMP